jgi:hypothetical protein
MMVVDEDVRVLEINLAGVEHLGFGDANHPLLRRRGGELLSCIHHGETREGCGHAEACRGCVVRGAVGEAMRGGSVRRRVTRMDLQSDTKRTTIHVRVTAAPFDSDTGRHVLLTLEDVSDVVMLVDLLPMCAWCRRVRTGDEYWQSVEAWLGKHLDIDVTHALCDDCSAKHFPERPPDKP